MPILKYLPGTTGDRNADMVRSVAGVLKALRAGKAATAASDDGALNVWIDDAKKYRCMSMRYMSVLDSRTFTRLPDVAPWAREWLRMIGCSPLRRVQHNDRREARTRKGKQIN